MSDNPEDTGQISVAELLARNGQKTDLSSGGRRRRGVKGGISVAELTGELPIIRDERTPDRTQAAPSTSERTRSATPELQAPATPTPATPTPATPTPEQKSQDGPAPERTVQDSPVPEQQSSDGSVQQSPQQSTTTRSRTGSQFQPVARRQTQAEPELLSGSTTVAGDMLNRSHDDTERGRAPRAPYGSRQATSRPAPRDAEPITDVSPVRASVNDLAANAAAASSLSELSTVAAKSRASAKSRFSIKSKVADKSVTADRPGDEDRAGSDRAGKDRAGSDRAGSERRESGLAETTDVVDTTAAPDTTATPSKTATPGKPAAPDKSAADETAADETATDTVSAKKSSVDEADDHSAAEVDADAADSRNDRHAKGGAKQWLILVGQAVVSLVVGALLFKGFEKLWDVLPWVALILAVLVIVGLVAVVRILRRTDDLISIVIAIAVGVFVTLGPLAFQLSTG